MLDLEDQLRQAAVDTRAKIHQMPTRPPSEVRRRYHRRRLAVVGAAAVGVVAVVGGTASLMGRSPVLTTASSLQPAPSTEATTHAPDLTLVVQPGEGPGVLAERLAAIAGPPATSGADHVGWVLTDTARVDIVFFNSTGEDPRRDENAVSTCLAAVSEEPGLTQAACRPGTERPASPTLVEGPGYLVGDKTYSILANGPDGITRAMVVTVNGQTIEIQTPDVVFASWPNTWGWGPPRSMTFIDATGKTLSSHEFLND